MRHQIAGRRLGRTSAHRKALFRNMVTSLLEAEQIVTTIAKAKELRRVAEKLITVARKDNLAARRKVRQTIHNKAVFHKLFTDIAPRFKNRPGGYTRVLHMGFRYGDNAEMAIIELVDKKVAAPPLKKGKKEAKKSAELTAKPKETEEEAPPTAA